MNTPIKREDIRKGDRIRMSKEYTATSDGMAVMSPDATYELVGRPVQLPTEPGFYLDRDGDVWKLTTTGRWVCLADHKYDFEEASFEPFTRLRPVAEVAAEVLAEVRNMNDRPPQDATKPHHVLLLSTNLDAIADTFGATK